MSAVDAVTAGVANLKTTTPTGNNNALVEEEDPDYGHLYGPVLPPSMLTAEKTVFTSISQLVKNPQGYLDKTITLRAHLHGVRGTAKNAFLLLRQRMSLIQAIASLEELKSKPMVKFIGGGGVTKESLVQITGRVVPAEIRSELVALKCAELHIQSLHVVHASTPKHPFNLDDAARPEDGPETNLPRVNLDTRLNNRVFDLKTCTNQAIFGLQSGIVELFGEYLRSHGFRQIFSPKLIGAASEGGANVFRLGYFDRHAFLAQSPQFYKQMAIAGGMERVFEVGPVFRAENSFTHRHLTEFVGLDLEMAFDRDYHEVMFLIADMLQFIFKELPARFPQELSIVRAQYPVEEFKFAEKPLVLTYPEAVALLRSDGIQIGDLEDMSTDKEKHLGKLIRALHNTDFYIIDKFPLNVRPFYTMPDPDMPVRAKYRIINCYLDHLVGFMYVGLC